MAGASSLECETALAGILGKGNVTSDLARLASYFASGRESPNLVAACPAETEEVQKIVEHCYASGVPIFTTYDTCFPEEVASQTGVLLDFHRMNRIERIDSKNLCVHIQRGVTFEQLEEALAPEGLTALVPAGARTRSVVCHTVSRGMNLAASKYPEVQASNMKVVLQDGRIHLTGAHAISEETSDWKEDGGPNLSKWYLGADDIFGIVVRASIWIYPRFEGRSFEGYGFSDFSEALALVKDLTPNERLVLRLWSTACRIDGELPLWVGDVTVLRKDNIVDLMALPITEAGADPGAVTLEADLKQTPEIDVDPGRPLLMAMRGSGVL